MTHVHLNTLALSHKELLKGPCDPFCVLAHISNIQVFDTRVSILARKKQKNSFQQVERIRKTSQLN